ncbi:MAG: hypothetical protein A4E65_03021 [Syntrophorhabdus sp. PtaU1.Bin153]|nr:MAG: hypothetical protein A4E65_03021 [Syntrophorhabdus sp. PtaU1.Bin153]
MNETVNETEEEPKSQHQVISEVHRTLYGCMGRIKLLAGFFGNNDMMDEVEEWDYTIIRQIADMIEEENDALDHMNSLLQSVDL